MTRHWVVSAGALGRDYTEAFLDFGMAFLGGDRPLAIHAQIEVGDVLLLKRGISQILAAGRVVDRGQGHAGRDDKDWLRDFDGWDRSGYCYVDWHVPEAPVSASRAVGLRQGTIYATDRPELKEIAARILARPPRLPQREEPALQRPVTDDEILEFLIAQGLRPSAADDLTTALRRIRLLAAFYYNRGSWEEVREHETRTFLVVPLLLALGWSEQQLKIEYPALAGRRIDVACFARAYRAKGQACPLIIETKGFASGLDYAPGQAKGYAAEFPSCRAVLVTNGYCYKLYRRDGTGSFSTVPSAYLNLLRPRAAYPLDPSVPGALEVLRRMLPGAVDDVD